MNPFPLTIVTFNVLAPVWVNPSDYPCVDPCTLDPPTRLPLIARCIETMNADVVTLQEVQGTEDVLGWLRDRLQVSYHFFSATHGPHLWSDYLPAGQDPSVPHGNTILIRKTVGSATDFVLSCVELSEDGNTMAVVEGRGLRIFNVHLETLHADIRRAQIASLLQKYPAPTPGGIDILAGDLNAPLPWLRPLLVEDGEYLPVGCVGFLAAAARPGSSAFAAEQYGVEFVGQQIDHVMLRGLRETEHAYHAHPAEDYVLLDDKTRVGYPGCVSDEVLGPKVEWILRQYGSDHMPVGCTITHLVA